MKKLSKGFFRLLLRLYPQDFREAYGPRMEEAFLASMAKQSGRLGWAGVALSWARVIWDTLVHAADLRFRPDRSPEGVPGRSGPEGSRNPEGESPYVGAFTDTLQELRLVVRSLGKNPTYASVIVLIAGLGITLTTLIFATLNASVLRPLPHVRDPQELVMVTRVLPSRPVQRARISYQDFLHFKERSTTLTDVVGLIPYHELMIRTGSGLDRQVIGGEVTGNYFQALGIPMILGRGILPEDVESENGVAVLGHATWLREFGGGRDALGKTIRVDGKQRVIVGVAPPGLGWLSMEPVEAAVWIPLRPRYKEAENWYVLNVAGRRRGETTLPQVQAEFDAIALGLAASDPERWIERAGEPVGLRAMTDRQARFDFGGPRGAASIFIYLVLVGLIMLITCSNVASLLLNRALRRQPEIALRLALGSGRGRLISGLLMESLVLFSMAGILSLLLIHWGTHLLAVGWGHALPAVADITVDGRVTFFAFGLTLASGVAFGMVPALRATRPDLAPALKGRGDGRRRGRFGARGLLVFGQVAGSTVLVAVSALLARDLQQAQGVELGFDPDGVIVASLDLSHGEYDRESGALWMETLTERLEGLPGVEGVSLALWVPMSGNSWNSTIRPRGFEIGPDESLSAKYNAVTPGYFEMVGMPLVEGRDFEPSDGPDAPLVVLVNEAFAGRYWPGQEPLGKGVALGDGGPEWEVVGVVRDAMYGLADLRAGEAEPHIWTPRAQVHHNPVQVHVRTLGAQAPIMGAVREEIRLLDEDLPIMELASMRSFSDKGLEEERAGAIMFGAFSLLALFLAALGIYGVMAHTVMERTREIGVRLAVGAGPGRVVGMILADGLRLSGLGIGVGLGLAILVGVGIRALLVGTSVLDPFSLSGSLMILVLAAAAAALTPALRAARLDPVVSLKSE